MAEALLSDPAFQAALKTVKAAVAAREAQAPASAQQPTDATAVAAEVEEARQRRQESIAAFTTAADQIWSLVEQQQPCDGVPPPLRAAAATLLRFYHADAASAAPAPALCREVRAVLDPATRPAVDTYGALLHQPQGDAGDAWGDPQPPFLTALPAWALAGGGAHDVQDLLPGRKLCSFLVDRNRCMLLGGPPPSDTVAGVPGGPLNVQTLMFMAAAAAKQVEGLHPLSLTLLDAGSERFVVRSVCGSAPCMEVAHLRLMTQQLADSLAERLSEMQT